MHIDGMVTQRFVFGWVLSRAWHTASHSPFISLQMLSNLKASEYDSAEFGDLETIGINPK